MNTGEHRRDDGDHKPADGHHAEVHNYDEFKDYEQHKQAREKQKHDDDKKQREQDPKSRRGRIALYVIGIAAVIAIGLFLLILHLHRSHADAKERDARAREQQLGPKVMVATALVAPVARKLTLPGDVRAWQVSTVYARVTGYLAERRVDRGDRVKAGQVLGVVSTPETELQLRPLEVSLDAKRAIANRLRPLVPAGVVAQQDLDNADSTVEQAKSEVDRLRALRGFNEIRAPFDGIVTARYVDVGALMPAPTGSTQSAQPLVDVADTSKVRVVIYVGQRDAVGVHLGDSVTITRDDDPLHPIGAMVSRIPDELDTRTRTMWVEADVDNADGRLYPGLFVTCALVVPAPGGVMIPSEAVSVIAGVPTVAIIKDGHAHFVKVDVADDDGNRARVIRGVAVGDKVAKQISDELADGGAVRPIEPGASGQGQGSGSGDAEQKAAKEGDKSDKSDNGDKKSGQRAGKPGKQAAGSDTSPGPCPRGSDDGSGSDGQCGGGNSVDTAQPRGGGP